MADTGKQSPLGAGVNGSLLQDVGLCLNPETVGYVGTSHLIPSYDPGSVVNLTCLFWLTYSINRGYGRVNVGDISEDTYGKLISIGQNVCEALGNAKPPTFWWYGPANTGDPTSLLAQRKSWFPYTAYNGVTNTYPISYPTPLQYSNLTSTDYGRDITQWGWIRCLALQAWDEFNWNGYPPADKVYYKEFCSSFQQVAGFMEYMNNSIYAQSNGPTFLQNTYSNIDDLSSQDISGISKATFLFGTDLIQSGRAIDLSNIDKFGLPSILLRTLGNNSGVTTSLILTLTAAGLDPNTINLILSGTYKPTVTQENQIFTAFLAITGNDLKNILLTLNCQTTGLNTLADLLNPKMLFPNSYTTLTVPVYNPAPGPTNSKTYYLIYDNGGVNSQLSNPTVKERTGYLGIPPLITPASNLGTNYQVQEPGFDSYLRGVLPESQAIACGAFGVSVGQVKNIKMIPVEQFAQIVQNIELISTNLPLTAGTNVPANTTLTNGGLDNTAFGSGPVGSYVMSDFLGCMSGLPYPWRDIQNEITKYQTVKLTNIYQELYLAITWDPATVTATYTSYVDPQSGLTYYVVTGITLDYEGYGYHRGTAKVPLITIEGGSGATAIVTSQGEDPYQLSSYGRVLGVQLTSPGSPSLTPPVATIQAPPIALLPVNDDGSKSAEGVCSPPGTVGWSSPMESVVLGYSDQANEEIQSIANNHPDGIFTLNRNWNITGTQLSIEQHARDIALQPVPTPKDNRMNVYPVTIVSFIDSVPSYALRTEPHMYAQTIERISDMNTPGGQSLIGQMRNERNKQRLMIGGLPLDDTLPGAPDPQTIKILLGNGTISAGRNGVPAGPATYTIPANQPQPPYGHYNQGDTNYCLTPQVATTNLGTIPIVSEIGQDLAGSNIMQVQNPIQPISGSAPTQPCTPLPNGNPLAGSLGGSPYVNIMPPILATPLTSGILLSNQYDIAGAIEEVVRCNCDCWLS
jgi:hypothetical protein